MGTILASTIINKASVVLHDRKNVRWSVEELLGYLNEGQRAILIYKSNAYVVSRSVQLVAGTKQTMPDDAVQLFDIPRNMGANGTTPGRAIRIAKREMLDAQVPDWHSADASAQVQHFTYEEASPRVFYVYPPQPTVAPGYVEMVFGAMPPNIDISAPIRVDDIYEVALLHFVLHRAWMKDSEFAADNGRSSEHLQAFITALTGKAKNEAGASPNMVAPATPSTPGN